MDNLQTPKTAISPRERLLSWGFWGLAPLLFGLSVFLFWQGTLKCLDFQRGVTEHLAHAAHASTLKIATTALERALTFTQQSARLQSLISQYSSWQAWHQNLTGLAENLKEVEDSHSLIEKEQMLNQVTRTLLRQADFGKESIITPLAPDVIADFSLGASALLIALILWFSIYHWLLREGKAPRESLLGLLRKML